MSLGTILQVVLRRLPTYIPRYRVGYIDKALGPSSPSAPQVTLRFAEGTSKLSVEVILENEKDCLGALRRGAMVRQGVFGQRLLLNSIESAARNITRIFRESLSGNPHFIPSSV